MRTLDDKISDINTLVAQLEPCAATYYVVLTPRRLSLYQLGFWGAGAPGLPDIELPGWLSELWLLQGRFKDRGLKRISTKALLDELHTVRDLLKEEAECSRP